MNKNNFELEKHLQKIIFTAALLVLTSGTIFFHYVEKWDWLDSYYYTVVTLATVGYGDFVPKTGLGRFAATILIFIGVGIIALFIQTVVKKRGKKLMDRELHKMSKDSKK
jgi:voltage-gated potassium channel